MDKHEPSMQEQKKQDGKDEERRFVAQLTDLQKKAMTIAKEHLGTSFTLSETLGFQKWKAAQATNMEDGANI